MFSLAELQSMEKILSGEKVGKALKTISTRLKDINMDTDKEDCKEYGCLNCKHYQREEGYDQQWGHFAFFYSKCKKQPDRNMYDHDNRYTIFDIEPDYSPHFHYDKAKGECPYYEEGENELVYMSEKEKNKIVYGG